MAVGCEIRVLAASKLACKCTTLRVQYQLIGSKKLEEGSTTERRTDMIIYKLF